MADGVIQGAVGRASKSGLVHEGVSIDQRKAERHRMQMPGANITVCAGGGSIVEEKTGQSTLAVTGNFGYWFCLKDPVKR